MAMIFRIIAIMIMKIISDTFSIYFKTTILSLNLLNNSSCMG